MHALLLFLTLTTSTLVLQSGDRIAVDGAVTASDTRVTFRSGGVLYSLPRTEVDLIASAKADEAVAEEESAAKPAADDSVVKLRVSEEQRKKMLEDLAKNHAGTPPSPEQLKTPPPLHIPSNDEIMARTDEEWSWRQKARDHQETVRRAHEDLELLEKKIEDLKWKIQNFVMLGYHPRQFEYDSTLLATTEEQIPYAQLAVERAERDYAQFMDDARRLGVMPGWLRP
jgi:hypothetical protein